MRGSFARPARRAFRRRAGLRAALLAALLLPAAAEAGTAPKPFDPMAPPGRTGPGARERPPGDPELGGLPAAPGAEATYYLCTACHSAAIIKQQRITDARWDDLWSWMIEQQGMPEQDPETRERILGYLKTYFSSER